MAYSDFHVHTTFSDGKNTPEEMVLAAIEKGMEAIGFTDHSYTFFDESYCMGQAAVMDYWNTVTELKGRYGGKINILCGIEQDYWSEESTEGFDFVIGSVHYVKTGDIYTPVDESPQIITDAVNDLYDGDIYAFIEEYYRCVGDVLGRCSAEIVGHFDLISKFNEDGKLFDEHHPRYVKAWREAANILAKHGGVFEINTGAMSRGYRTTPYPSMEMIEYIRGREGRFMLSSDAHSTQTLCYAFEKFEHLI